MVDRYVDLLKQGFMKPLKQKKQKKANPIISCDKCKDWHPKGKHIRNSNPNMDLVPIPPQMKHGDIIN